MDFSSFLTSLLTSFMMFLVLMFLFAWLSRKPVNRVIYYPNRILKGLDPYEGSRSSITRNPFAWIREALSSTEEDVISMSGVDAAAYFVFLATVLRILVMASIFLLPVLLPVAGTDTGERRNITIDPTSGTYVELDTISMGNVKLGSQRLWAFVIATYWVSFVAYYLLWKAYQHVFNLRAYALSTPEVRPEEFAVLVQDIPPPSEGQSRQEQVDTFFKKIYPDTFYRSMILTNNKKANRIWLEIEGFKKKLQHAEAVYALSKKTAFPEGQRPKHKTGLFGLIGTKVDSISYYSEKITELTPKLAAEQDLTRREKQLPAAIVFFTTRVGAASASQALMARQSDTWTTMNAPESRQLIWSNLTKKFYARQIRRCIVYLIVSLTIVFSIIPMAFISAVTTLENLKKFLPFLESVVEQDAIKTVLEAYLPQLGFLVFLALLPYFLMFLSKVEGIPSKSHMIRAASGKYFYYTVFNVFIGVTVGGIFYTLKIVQEQPKEFFPILARSLPRNASFFLTFVALQFFVGYGLELSRIIPLIIYHIKRKYICKSEAELKEAWSPGDLAYGTSVPSDMLILTIVLCYSVIAPVILPFGVVYFGLGWLVTRNQVLKVYVPSYESNGRMWPHMHTHIMAALILFQLTMFTYFGIKRFFYTPILLALPILSLIFSFVCHKKFYKFFLNNALEVACDELKETPNMEIVFKSYIPQCLCPERSGVEKHGEVIPQESGEEEKSGDALSQFSTSVLSV